MKIYCNAFVFLFGFLMILCLPVEVVAQTNLSWPVLTKENKPWTRWWWMGNAVDSTGINYNLEAFSEVGIGGVEITPIYGVKGYEDKEMDFLSPQWMEMFDFTVDGAEELNMGVDVNNGTGWPFGGKQINLDNAATKQVLKRYELGENGRLQNLIKIEDERQKEVTSLKVVMGFSDDGQKVDLTDRVDGKGRLNWEAPSGNWEVIALFVGKTLQQVKRSSPGGEGLVMDHFSKTALRQYLEPVNESFEGHKRPRSFFSDSYEVYGADWTVDFLEEFEERRGYSLKNYLPELLGEGDSDTIARVVMDYRKTISDLVLHNFSEKWHLWSKNMGSINRYQAHGAPGNLLDLYATADIPETETFGTHHFDVPGLPVDSLGKDSGDLDPLVFKFASSASHIKNKKLTSSETFTWLGEHFRTALSQFKPVADLMFLSGINHIFFHGSTYSPKDAPWPGWKFYASVDLSPYNPVWKDLPSLNEYIGRVQSFLQKGQPDNDVLLYWPVHDAWAMKTNNLLNQLTVHNAKEWLYPTNFYKIGNELMGAGVGFDYVSDRQIGRDLEMDKDVLHTPGGSYKALIVPLASYIPLSTMEKLEELAKKGARIIFVGGFPEDVSGLHKLDERRTKFKRIVDSLSKGLPYSNTSIKDYYKGKILKGNNVLSLVRASGVRIPGFSKVGLQYVRRKDSKGPIYFISNLSNRDVEKWISLTKELSSVVFYDPVSGKIGQASTRKKGNETQVFFQLKPGQSIILRGYDQNLVEGEKWQYYNSKGGDKIEINKPWTIVFEEGEPQISEKFTIEKLRSWTAFCDRAKAFSGTVRYKSSFKIENIDEADEWLLDLGTVNFSADLSINGQRVGTLWSIPFETEIGRYLRHGKNTIEVEVTNIGANRIMDYDQRGEKWKIFKDINIVDMNYKPFDATDWRPVPSGLLGPVSIIPLKKANVQ